MNPRALLVCAAAFLGGSAWSQSLSPTFVPEARVEAMLQKAEQSSAAQKARLLDRARRRLLVSAQKNPANVPTLQMLVWLSYAKQDSKLFAQSLHRLQALGQGQASDYWAAAEWLFGLEDYAGALEFIRFSEAIEGQTLRSASSKQAIYLRLYQGDSALNSAAEYCVQQPNDARAALLYAQTLGEIGASDEAYLAFVSLKKLFPENTEVRWQFLLWAKANDRLAESLAEAEGIWSDPDITERAKVAYASQLLTLNPRDQPSAALAVRWAEGLLRQDSANPAYWALRGDVARWLDDLPTAEESWRRCLSLPGGTQWPVFQQILQLDLDKGDSEALLFDAKAAQGAHPEHPFGPLFLGVAQSRRGDHAMAHSILMEGINRFGSDKEVREQYLLYLGEVCYRLGLLNEFRGHFDEAISISRSNPTVLNNYAYFLALLKIDLKKAEALALRAVAIADQEASFWDTLATVYASQGKHAKAQSAMDRAHSLGADPSRPFQRTNEAPGQ